MFDGNRKPGGFNFGTGGRLTSGFGFGTPTASATTTAAAPAPAPDPGDFCFGGTSTPAAEGRSTSGFCFGPPPASGGFCFGGTSTPAAEGRSTSAFSFGPPPASGGFCFGGTSTPAAGGRSTSGFCFGTPTTSVTTTAAGPGGFCFGGTITPAAGGLFGTTTTTTSSTTGGGFAFEGTPTGFQFGGTPGVATTTTASSTLQPSTEISLGGGLRLGTTTTTTTTTASTTTAAAASGFNLSGLGTTSTAATVTRMIASTSTDSGYVDNWQSEKSVTECNLKMLTTEKCSDAIFRVGSDKEVVRAHRYVLVSRSSVFDTMFCGPLAEKGEVTIPEIEPRVFKEFLRFLYTDNVSVTVENVTGMLYTSRKYDVNSLLDQCSAFIETALKEQNVCLILEHCHAYGDLDLQQKALEILTKGGERVIEAPGFLELCCVCLDKFLRSEDLKLKEERVFAAVLRWAEQQCLKEAVPLNHQNVCRFLGNMRYQIRYASLSLDYLSSVVVPSQFLHDSERLRIMDCILRPNIDISPFIADERRYQRSLRYVNIYRAVSTDWCCGPGTYEVAVSNSKGIHLVGFQMLGPINQDAEYTISIRMRSHQRGPVIFPKKKFILAGNESVNDIFFREPRLLDRNVYYSLFVTVTFEGEDLCSGFGEHMLRSIDGVDYSLRHRSNLSPLYGLIFQDIEMN